MERRRPQPKPSENNPARNIIQRSYRLAQQHYERKGNALSLEASQSLDSTLAAFHQWADIESQVEELKRNKGRKTNNKITSSSSERIVTGPSVLIRQGGSKEYTWRDQSETRLFTKTLVESMGETEGIRFRVTQLSKPGEPYAELTYSRIPGEKKGKLKEEYWLEMGKTDTPPLVKVHYDNHGHVKQILHRITPEQSKPLQGYEGDTLVASDRNYDAVYTPIDIIGKFSKRFVVPYDKPRKLGDTADLPTYMLSVNDSGFYIYVSMQPKGNVSFSVPDSSIYIPWSLHTKVIKGLLTDNSDFDTGKLLDNLRTSCTSHSEQLMFNTISAKE